MFGNTHKKNINCQQQAIHTLQNMFPALNLCDLSKNSSLWEVVEKSAQKLPKPCLGDITHTINNMKNVVDKQQLKIQKNMIQIQEYEQTYLKKQTSAPVYQQKINNDYYRHHLTDTKQQLYQHSEKGDFEFQRDDIQNFQFVENHKEGFFCEPAEQYYFQSNNTDGNLNSYLGEEEDYIKKYLSFDY